MTVFWYFNKYKYKSTAKSLNIYIKVPHLIGPTSRQKLTKSCQCKSY